MNFFGFDPDRMRIDLVGFDFIAINPLAREKDQQSSRNWTWHSGSQSHMNHDRLWPARSCGCWTLPKSQNGYQCCEYDGKAPDQSCRSFEGMHLASSALLAFARR